MPYFIHFRLLSIGPLLVLLGASCINSPEVDTRYKMNDSAVLTSDLHQPYTPLDDTLLANALRISPLEKKMLDSGLVDIQKVDSTIHIDLKYTTTENFVGTDLYGDLTKVYFQPEIAERLSKAQSALKMIDSSLSLLIYDGTRPRSVQWKMWKALDTVPVNDRVKFVSNPVHGSIHNYGCAVDLTIIDLKTMEPLDMGAGFDDPRKIAYPKFEKDFLASGELTQQHYDHRQLLRKVMRSGGFWVLPTEWWHFNGYSRKQAQELFSPIE